jgi:antitoxin HicB
MKYPALVFWSDEDEGYLAVVPDLPGCSAFGNTPKEAVREIGDPTLAWIAACRAAGDPPCLSRPPRRVRRREDEHVLKAAAVRHLLAGHRSRPG